MRQALFLQRNGASRDRFETDILPERPGASRCDRRQIGQALTNMLQECRRSDRDAGSRARGGCRPGRIVASRCATSGGMVAIAVEDNGKGLPQARSATA